MILDCRRTDDALPLGAALPGGIRFPLSLLPWHLSDAVSPHLRCKSKARRLLPIGRNGTKRGRIKRELIETTMTMRWKHDTAG